MAAKIEVGEKRMSACGRELTATGFPWRKVQFKYYDATGKVYLRAIGVGEWRKLAKVA